MIKLDKLGIGDDAFDVIVWAKKKKKDLTTTLI